MTIESTVAPAPQSPATQPLLINVLPGALEAMNLYEREVATYLRALPRLLEEGHAWRHALVKGDEVLSIWDTQGDAIQAARQHSGPDESIFVKTIDPRDPERFALLDAWKKAQCPP